MYISGQSKCGTNIFHDTTVLLHNYPHTNTQTYKLYVSICETEKRIKINMNEMLNYCMTWWLFTPSTALLSSLFVASLSVGGWPSNCGCVCCSCFMTNTVATSSTLYTQCQSKQPIIIHSFMAERSVYNPNVLTRAKLLGYLVVVVVVLVMQCEMLFLSLMVYANSHKLARE